MARDFEIWMWFVWKASQTEKIQPKSCFPLPFPSIFNEKKKTTAILEWSSKHIDVCLANGRCDSWRVNFRSKWSPNSSIYFSSCIITFLKQRTTQIKLVCDHVDLQHERYALCVMFSIQARINYYFHSSHSYEGEK